MNDLTIIFFEQLAKRLESAAPLVDRLRGELVRDTQERMGAFLLPSTLFLSAAGREFRARLDDFLQRAAAMRDVGQVRALYKRLIKLEAEAKKLREETLAALQSPGRLDAARVHVILYGEAGDASARIYAAICLDMYRLAVAGGGKALEKLPPLHYVHPTAAAYYQYYAKDVLPALELMDRSRRYGVWAFQYREQAKIGALARLPVYVQAEPRTERTRLLPGEYRLAGGRNNDVWQGIGAITNLTPANVARAQQEGVYYTVTAEMLSACPLTGAPSQILDHCFGGRFYAVDAVHFFSMLSAALCARALRLRAQRGQCLYCGANDAGTALCLSCMGKVRQKI